MRQFGIMVAVAATLMAMASPARAEKGKQDITLDGERVEVFFSDGDSFRSAGKKPRPDYKARLAGFNTLESYGPVHRWGEWSTRELYRLAKDSTDAARSGNWTCTTQRRPDGSQDVDGYGRVLVSCPDLAEKLVSEGLAHVFLVDPKDEVPALLERQKEAQAAGKGMWAKGVPKVIVTSLHSSEERSGDSEWKPYNRIVDTATGVSAKRHHASAYEMCQEVCEDDACLVYVPFNQRYGDKRAHCLR